MWIWKVPEISAGYVAGRKIGKSVLRTRFIRDYKYVNKYEKGLSSQMIGNNVLRICFIRESREIVKGVSNQMLSDSYRPTC